MKTFRLGGVHPPENKWSAGNYIRILLPPEKAVFPLTQHIGLPAVPLVRPGDRVKVGTRIAEAGGILSADICSSVSGIVQQTDRVTDHSGYRTPAIVIKTEGDEWESYIDRSSDLMTECLLSPTQILQRIKNAGIVGMGGAGFPTHVKLSPPEGCSIDCVVVNAVECEPYLTADHRLMLEHPDEILVGTRILMRAVGAVHAYIGIESNKKDAIELLSAGVADFADIQVVPLRIKYPQGGEKQLIQALTGRCVPPPPAIPAQVGVVVQNVATVYAIYQAVQKNMPLLARVVTVTGGPVRTPSNFLVRLGTPVSSLVEAAGGLSAPAGKILSGGPMMGKALSDLSAPVCKGTSGIVVLGQREALRQITQPCIRCAKCVEVCPLGLEPYLLATCSARHLWDEAEQSQILSCMECGSCQYVCPSHRPMLDYIRLGKAQVASNIRARKNR